MRSPDKTDEEKKYRSLEFSNTRTDTEESKTTTESEKITQPLEKEIESVQNISRLQFYKNKIQEIERIISDKRTIGLLGLTDIIEDVYYLNYTNCENNIKRNLKLIKKLTKNIEGIENDGIQTIKHYFGDFVIEPFGSSVNGFYMNDKDEKSDLDLSINFYSNPTVNKEKVLNSIIPAIDIVSNGKYNLIFECKTPIIKYTDSETLVECDLCVNGILGVYNSKLIKTYTNTDSQIAIDALNKP